MITSPCSISRLFSQGVVPPGFSKTFTPSTIGPGSSSLLTFTIDNSESSEPVELLSFVDNLPAAIVIADAPKVTSSCNPIGVISAPAGGSTITFTGGSLAAGATCSFSLYVTSDQIGEGAYTNVSGDLTSSAGNSGPAMADLTVSASRPGFTKSFSPSTIDFGETSTLTLTIDNTANTSLSASISFTDNLPTGLKIASPTNFFTDCTGSFVALPGSSTISHSSGFLLAGASCTVSVDVIAAGSGVLENATSGLLFTPGGPQFNSGSATASIEVTRGDLHLSKQFTNDPVPPGGMVDLEFTITNFDRNEAASGISFSDNLDAVLSGLAPAGILPSEPCGPGSGLNFSMGVLTLTGGSLPQEGTCTFTVTCLVPITAVPGSYHNTTTEVSGTVAGDGVIGNEADADLFVSFSPLLTKTFIDNPVAPGGSTNMEFTITNTSSDFALTNVAFGDTLTKLLSVPVTTTLPSSGFCGMGSSIIQFSTGLGQVLSIAGANLPAGGSCTFQVGIDIPAGISGGIYTNTTSKITGVVDGENVEGNPASDDLEVLSAPSFSKEFLNDPVVPGTTVDLEFNLTYDEFASGDATSISFTDDLEAVLAGLMPSTTLPVDPCGTGSSLSFMGGVLSLNDGILSPGGSCSFVVTLDVPLDAPIGTHTNTTSNIEALVLGQNVQGNVASADFLVNPLTFTKEFIGDPALPGELVTLQFTIDNTAGTDPVTAISFTDNLSSALSGLVAEGLPMMDICGAGSSISGTSNLTFTGGSVNAGSSCTFAVPVRVPMAATSGNYPNITSNFTAMIGGEGVVLPPATDGLEINTDILAFTKEFTDDPILPGSTVTLEFYIENLDPIRTITAITFTDDLDATLSGLVAVGLPTNDVCGAGSQISGTSLLTFTGGSLGPGASCTFSVTLQVPAMVSASDFINTTSIIAGEVNGVPVAGPAATDVLKIRNLSLEKEFSGVGVGGGTVDLTFTLQNLQTDQVSGIGFYDDLTAMLAGATILTLPEELSACGEGAMVSGEGTSILSFTNGELAAGSDCMFTITVQLPPCVTTGQYMNTTSEVSVSGLPSPPATATLEVIADGPPVITCPGDPEPIELPLSFDPTPVGPNTPQDPSIDPSIYGTATATDNSEMISITYQDVVLPPPSTGCPNSYQVERTWKAVDECDSISICVQLFSFFTDPAPAGEISGPVTICPSLNNLPYSTSSTGSTTSYNWSFDSPSGTIMDNGSHQISISFDNTFTGGTLSVTTVNDCGISAPQTLNILLGSPQFCELTSCLAENDDVNVTNELLAQMGAPDVYRAINNLESAATIQALKTIVFRAGNEILLIPPFTVEQGAVFVAEIEACVMSISNK